MSAFEVATLWFFSTLLGCLVANFIIAAVERWRCNRYYKKITGIRRNIQRNGVMMTEREIRNRIRKNPNLN